MQGILGPIGRAGQIGLVSSTRASRHEADHQIAPSPPPLKAGETYPADRALAMLVEAARVVLQGDDTRS